MNEKALGAVDVAGQASIAVPVARAAGTVAELESWVERVGAAPERALRRAEDLLESPSGEAEELLAHHVACLAHVEQGRLSRARQHAERGLTAASRGQGLQRALAALRLTLAWVELEHGDAAAVRAQLDAVGDQTGRGRPGCLHGLLHCQAGRYGQALRELDAALPELHRDGDRRWTANALVGRGIARLNSGHLSGAEEDFVAAEGLYRADGMEKRAAACQHNLGCVASRAGDLPGALRWFERAVTSGLDTAERPEVLVDRASTLAEAGLTTEAANTMETAAERLAVRGRRGQLAETLLALARCSLAAGRAGAATAWAMRARRLFRSQGRPAWAAVAAAVNWQGRLAVESPSGYGLAAVHRIAADCAGHGWTAVAVELLITASRAALANERPAQARALLSRAYALRGRGVTGAPQRAMVWLAEAMLASLDGERSRVFRACRSGLRIVDEHAAAFASVELQSRAGDTAVELARLAIEEALSTGDPRVFLDWSERYRAGTLARPALSPPSDPALAAELLELRTAALELRRTRDAPAETLRSRVATLEQRVRRRAMTVDSGRGLRKRLRLSDVRRKLGRTALLSLLAHRGRMRGVSVVDGHVRMHDLGSEDEISAQVEALRFALAQRAHGACGSQSPMVDAIPRITGELERTLLGPVLDGLPGGHPLLVVPTGPLHALPWSALPACRGRPVTVAPSLSCWSRAADAARRPADGAVWVAGPDLSQAEREVRDLHAVAGGTLLTGQDASTSAVLSEMDGVGLAHIATHGWFRPDQPLLSCVDMADGPLYAYDLDRLRNGPKTMVLSACEVGRCAVRPGDDLMGFAATLLGRGTATLIASVLPVPDQRTAAVMASLHSGLRCGLPPAEALAHAQAEHGEMGFICLGVGDHVVN